MNSATKFRRRARKAVMQRINWLTITPETVLTLKTKGLWDSRFQLRYERTAERRKEHTEKEGLK